MAVNQGFIAMKCRHRLSPLYVWLWTVTNMDRILEQANGSTFLEISKRAFRPLPAIVPIKSVRDVFGQVMQPLYRRLVKNERESRALASLRDTLLPKLVSGEVRVNNARSCAHPRSESHEQHVQTMNSMSKGGLTKSEQAVRFLCLFEELESSRDLIKSGFGHLQEIDMSNTFYHLPHQLMASGLERFMKCYVLLIYEGRHGSYPNNAYVNALVTTSRSCSS